MQAASPASKIARIAVTAFVAFSLIFIVSALQPESAHASDTQLSACATGKLVKKGTLTVLTSPDYPPFENLENGKCVGYDIDVAKAVTKRLGLKVKFKSISFDEIFTLIAAGKKGDIAISGITTTSERKKIALASRPYYTEKMCIVVAKGSKYTSVKSLNKSSVDIAVQCGTEAEAIAYKYLPKANVMAFSTSKYCLDAFKNGEVDACIMNSSLLTGQKGFKKIKTISGEKYVIYLNKSNKKLKTDIDKALVKLEKNGTLKKLRKKWGL